MHLYIIYQVTNKINNKFYIGIHKTKDIDDSYMGSGKLIKHAINKYGVENFDKKILHIFTNKIEANKKERELVNESLLNNKMCYNLKEGGYGGFDHIHKKCKTSRHATFKKIKIHNPHTEEKKTISQSDLKKYISEGWVKGFSVIHKQRLSEGAKAKIQTKLQRQKNSERKKNGLLFIKNNKLRWLTQREITEYESKGWVRYIKQCPICFSFFKPLSIRGFLCSPQCRKKRQSCLGKKSLC